jgi:hypothetical protein
MMFNRSHKKTLCIYFFSLFCLSGCKTVRDPQIEKEDRELLSRSDQKFKNVGQLTAGDNFVFGASKKEALDRSFLWNASLQVLSFMPLSISDEKGGVLVTKWWISHDQTNYRKKVDVRFFSSETRAGAFKVKVFIEAKKDNGWISLPTNEKVEKEIEKAILMKASEIRQNKV